MLFYRQTLSNYQIISCFGWVTQESPPFPLRPLLNQAETNSTAGVMGDIVLRSLGCTEAPTVFTMPKERLLLNVTPSTEYEGMSSAEAKVGGLSSLSTEVLASEPGAFARSDFVHCMILETDSFIQCSCGRKIKGRPKTAKSNFKRHLVSYSSSPSLRMPDVWYKSHQER